MGNFVKATQFPAMNFAEHLAMIILILNRLRQVCHPSFESSLNLKLGNEHTVVLAKSGKVFSCGNNANGQCGRVRSMFAVRFGLRFKFTQGILQEPTTLTLVDSLLLEPVSQVHAYNGCEHTIVVTRNGRLVSFGFNCRGQLGIGHNKSEHPPQNITGIGSSRVLTLSCSYYHTVVACVENQTFSFGRNDYGQLGHGDLLDKQTVHEIRDLRGTIIVTLACGQYHTCAGASDGHVIHFLARQVIETSP